MCVLGKQVIRGEKGSVYVLAGTERQSHVDVISMTEHACKQMCNSIELSCGW